ncbi:hypothetical protein ES707_01609 [subsurface metagenome]|jgi:lysophospholipase L1-like esterase
MLLARIFFYGVLILLAGTVLAMLPGDRSALRWRLIVAAVMAGMIGLLSHNLLDVAHWYGRAVYGVITIAGLCAVMAGLALASNTVLRLWFGLGAFLLLIEAGFRTFPVYDTFAANPGIAYFWPDWISYPYNAFGHRDRPFVVPKPAGTYRIVLLGDSFTEGAGLSREQTFGRLMEAKLGSGFEVYNLAHAGMNTREEADVLLRDGGQLDPDLLILNYVFNDAETHPHTKIFQTQPEWYLTAQRILNQRFGSYAAYGALTYVVAPLLPANYENGLAVHAAYHRDVDGKGWSEVKSGLADISQWSASRKIPVVGVIWPFLADEWQTGSESLHTQVRSAMQASGLDVVDLGPVFSKLSPHLADFGISAVDSHPNARANQVVASVLLEKVKALHARR